MTDDANQPPHGEGDDIEATPQGDPTSDVSDASDIDPVELQRKLDEAIANSRKWERRAKNADAEWKRKVASMVEPEKVIDAETRAANLETELAEERKARLREKVARQMQLPDSLADVLRGDNEDEMREHAEKLIADIPAMKPKAQAAKEGSNAAGAKPSLTPAEALKVAALG